LSELINLSPNTQRIVFADANVLYSRVLRDYLLYAAIRQLITVAWSKKVLDEVERNLLAKNPSFTVESAKLLIEKMTDAFPYAEIDPDPEHYEQLLQINLPDEDDRHVLAAAIAAEAEIICTSNTKDFPASIASELGMKVMSPDELLSWLTNKNSESMLDVHNTVVTSYQGSSDVDTLEALKRAGATNTADLLRELNKKLSINAILQAQQEFSGVAHQSGNPSEEGIQTWVDDVRYKDEAK